MKNVFRISTLLFAAMIICDVTAIAQPKIKVLSGKTYDWGEVAPDILKTNIKVVNIGTETLRITNIGRSCGCTTTPIDKNELKTNDTATIEVSVDAKKSNGEKNSQITIISNDPVDSTYAIVLHATIVRDLLALPKSFSAMINMSVGERGENSVDITNTGKDTVFLNPPYVEGEGAKVEFNIKEPYKLAPGRTMILEANVLPLSEGYKMLKVILPTTSKYVKTMELDLFCQVDEVKTKNASQSKK